MKSQALNFNDIIETIYGLPLEEKEDLKNMLEHNIADERRNEIANNFKESKKELESGKLKFSSNIDELKDLM